MADWEQIGGYSTSDRDGVSRSQFNIRTPEKGLQFGPVNLSGAYGSQTQSVTPEALGMSEDFLQFMRERGTPVQSREDESTTWNVGIAAHLPGGVLPSFMERVLRPQSVNVRYGQSEQNVTNPYGQEFEKSDRMRGIGGQAQILRGMFGENAPSVGVQYMEPNLRDQIISGNIGVPVAGGNVELYGSRNINEDRPNEGIIGLRGRIPLAEGGTVKEGSSPVTATDLEHEFWTELIEPSGPYWGRTSELLEEVPSFSYKDRVVSVNREDLNALDKFVEEIVSSDGASSVPPRVRDGSQLTEGGKKWHRDLWDRSEDVPPFYPPVRTDDPRPPEQPLIGGGRSKPKPGMGEALRRGVGSLGGVRNVLGLMLRGGTVVWEELPPETKAEVKEFLGQDVTTGPPFGMDKWPGQYVDEAAQNAIKFIRDRMIGGPEDEPPTRIEAKRDAFHESRAERDFRRWR